VPDASTGDVNGDQSEIVVSVVVTRRVPEDGLMLIRRERSRPPHVDEIDPSTLEVDDPPVAVSLSRPVPREHVLRPEQLAQLDDGPLQTTAVPPPLEDPALDGLDLSRRRRT